MSVCNWVYDLETYPNIFTAVFYHVESNTGYQFEISDRVNQYNELMQLIKHCKTNSDEWIGFNNLYFDYPIIDEIMNGEPSHIDSQGIYELAMQLINTGWGQGWKNQIKNPKIPQIDLFKIHHFDNDARATSLKTLEMNMRLKRVRDLPFSPGVILNDQQKDILLEYNWDDVYATFEFYKRSIKHIELRKKLEEIYSVKCINSSNAKIGSDLCVLKLKESGIDCYQRVDGRSIKRQTPRESIDLSECIFSYVLLEHPEFVRIKNYLQNQTVTGTKGIFTDLEFWIDDVRYKVGMGGLHASVESQVFESNSEWVIIDVDAAGFYPQMAIKNQLYPEHLGIGFCDTLDQLMRERKQYPKGSAENAGLKEAGNATYGNSNQKFSVFYDPKYTLTTTISGQLTLFMLIEQLMKVPELRMVQVNTDGVTYFVKRQYLEHTRKICNWWEQVTRMTLEENIYKRMFILNVNSYIAECENGNLKRKKDFAYGDDLDWSQNFSMQIVAKACEAVLIRNEDLEEYIYSHDDLFDFCLHTKIPRSSYAELENGQRVDNVIRYIVSTDGQSLTKVSPPIGTPGEFKRANKLTDEYFNSVMNEIGPGVWDQRIHTKNKSKYDIRRTAINAGYKITVCNDADEMNHVSIDYSFYIAKCKKILSQLGY